MEWYDSYLRQVDFHPVAAFGKLVQKGKIQLYTKGKTIHETKNRICKTENKTTKQEKNTNKTLKHTI